MVAGGNHGSTFGRLISSDTPAIISYQGFAQGHSEEAIKEFPNSPEILVMSAASRIESIIGAVPPHKQEWTTILKHLRQAQSLDPKWADAQYWYGLALDSYGKYANYGTEKHGQGQDQTMLSQAKASVLTALRLDPGMKAECFRLLGYIAEDRKQYREALTYGDAWAKEDPMVKKGPIFSMWRGRVLGALNKQSTSN